MNDFIEVALYTGAAGAAIPLGGVLARIEHIQPRWLEQELRHGVIAFGGGVLLSAIALVLVPYGIKHLSMMGVAAAFSSGGLVFLWLDRLIWKHGGSVAQLTAMLLDFLPEALALGATFASGKSTGLLLAFLISLQNLPEGFNSFRELNVSEHISSNKTLLFLLSLVILGPTAGLVGLTFLSDEPVMIGSVMLFASGGILYLTFQDIAPQAQLRCHWAPPLGAVAGFLLGLLGQMLIVH